MKRAWLFLLTAFFMFPGFSSGEERAPGTNWREVNAKRLKTLEEAQERLCKPVIESTQKFSFAFYQEILKY